MDWNPLGNPWVYAVRVVSLQAVTWHRTRTWIFPVHSQAKAFKVAGTRFNAAIKGLRSCLPVRFCSIHQPAKAYFTKRGFYFGVRDKWEFDGVFRGGEKPRILKAPLLGEQRTAASAACESPSPCGWSWRAAPEGLLRLAELLALGKSQES